MPAESLAARAGTVHAESARAIRAELAGVSLDALGANTALFMRQQRDPQGTFRYADVVLEGGLTSLSELAGQRVYAGSSFDDDETIVRLRRGRWSMSRPDRRHTNRFSTLRQDFPHDALDALPAWRQLYVPNGIIDQARMFVVGGGRVHGWFGLFTTAREGRFSRKQMSELNRAAKPLSNAVLAADALDAWDDGRGLVIVGADGRLEAAAADIASWLDADRTSRIGAHVRALDAGRGPEVFAVDRALCRATRLDGPTGVRYVVTLTSSLPALAPDANLSPRQREVAEHAALGMTIGEIADALELSAQTVKGYLKDVYQTLGVANRVELFRLLHDV